MKKFFVLSCLLISVSAFADIATYSGSNEGASCLLRLDLRGRYASLGNCGVIGSRNFENDGKMIIIEGGAEFTDCRIEIALGKNNEPSKAVLKTKTLFKPFYTTVHTCNDLVRVK